MSCLVSSLVSNPVQYGTLQSGLKRSSSSTIHYDTVQYSAMHHSTVPYSALPRRTQLDGIVWPRLRKYGSGIPGYSIVETSLAQHSTA